MDKKFWIGFPAVFVTIAVLDFLVNNVLLSATYADESMKHLWRAPEDMKVWIFFVVYLFIAPEAARNGSPKIQDGSAAT